MTDEEVRRKEPPKKKEAPKRNTTASHMPWLMLNKRAKQLRRSRDKPALMEDSVTDTDTEEDTDESEEDTDRKRVV